MEDTITRSLQEERATAEQTRAAQLARVRTLEVLINENRQFMSCLLARARSGRRIGEMGMNWARHEIEALKLLYNDLKGVVQEQHGFGFTLGDIAYLDGLGAQLAEAGQEWEWIHSTDLVNRVEVARLEEDLFHKPEVFNPASRDDWASGPAKLTDQEIRSFLAITYPGVELPDTPPFAPLTAIHLQAHYLTHQNDVQAPIQALPRADT